MIRFEIGARLRRRPRAPKSLPEALTIRQVHRPDREVVAVPDDGKALRIEFRTLRRYYNSEEER